MREGWSWEGRTCDDARISKQRCEVNVSYEGLSARSEVQSRRECHAGCSTAECRWSVVGGGGTTSKRVGRDIYSMYYTNDAYR